MRGTVMPATAAVAGHCAAAAAMSGARSLLALVLEGVFYAAVAGLWLLVIQWDLLDRWLGGPGKLLPAVLSTPKLTLLGAVHLRS